VVDAGPEDDEWEEEDDCEIDLLGSHRDDDPVLSTSQRRAEGGGDSGILSLGAPLMMSWITLGRVPPARPRNG
jgi:hypothetical protein